ncbi:sodium:proton antiporter [Mesorhizobium sp. M8A.F.Ca.ET.202.01.1.1]|nr:sodium:proton antiporter [Mesorhizobium sp. M8A.F.Ca.ET.202.01.1.1]TGR26784.1 sodium:proton antiporter [Mesorhizobium sp. M8A.F.Ca.ET.197.01.1.1]TGR42580.1 sodium:proton antiporter [bacterium M00.F.Ca.ET.199.01.1.1]TGR51338.1 sodium:proton antiporter [Mesorhizobium sp. M8A.F.Ca.ET.198.01.1.1]TGU30249.1 sodium:proton antiporter [bacterium M00.F.Ca.ET.156.01.1.1]TGV82306.1 sodium:proton antiporter [Mesorhizobium sp. M00.F.Ca.ET.149.01.1.1]TIT65290.1 MAG: sodium:proton antiporter [Mesorhizobi
MAIGAAGVIIVALLFPVSAFAAEEHGLPGAAMSLWWALPFAGLLLSIATGPLLFHHVWEHHYGKIAALWAALVIVPLAVAFGAPAATEAVLHALLTEYMSFIVLLFALYTISGGILLAGNIHGTPLVNAGLLVVGAALASVIGTTGASMILIRPILRANDNRPFNAHVVIFFIFLVSNIGGSLTPLGDPPLFVGFLRGVDFFWTTANLWRETLFVVVVVLAVFLAIDLILHRREAGAPKIKDPTPDTKVRLRGLANLPLLAGVIGAILLSAAWRPGVSFSVFGVGLELQNLVRDAIILALALLSLPLSHKSHRRANGFNWGPIAEVAKLFAGIFICIVPVVAILRAGHDGALAPLVALVTSAQGTPNDLAYFWLTGALSSFLDNAPTYLVFFELAGGDPQHLMTEFASTLAAISAGAVFMGANTYIGNAPNFMVYAIARHRGVKMPGFFGYMLWSGLVLIPTFLIAGFLFLG